MVESMSKKTKGAEPSKNVFQGRSQGEPTLGFQMVALGLIVYIVYTAKLFISVWLFPVAVALVITGFVMLIVDALGKIKIH